MPTFFGLSAMPTTLLNAVLGVLPDRSEPVRGRDRIAVVSPMYNEATGAERALASLLRQDPEPHELAISVNGSSDRTYDAVIATLVRFGFRRDELGSAPGFAAGMERWRHTHRSMVVLVFIYRQRTAKSEALNNIITSPVLSAERLLVVDGDTVFTAGFVRALGEEFYRLRWERGRPVVEDYALQSGTVTSFLPADARPLQRFISAGRSAEYAFASVVRRGQVRTMGRSKVWGSSRLYTVVGCGFVARRDVLPMPSDTQTEDHDLTLAAQSAPMRVEWLRPSELDERGLRLVRDGREVRFSEVLDPFESIEFRRGGGARFVGGALMLTEDPAHVGGYLRQIERWNGGGIQNALKRVWGDPDQRRISPNVRFTVLAAQFENLLGLLLLLLFPAVLALGLTDGPGMRSLVRNVLLWLGIDVAAALAMSFTGFLFEARSGGHSGRRALGEALRRTAQSWIPYMALKIANPVSYVAAATRAIPAFVRERRARRRSSFKTSGVAWERPTVRSVDRRTVHTAASMGVSLAAVFAAILLLAPSTNADQLATERLLRSATRVSVHQHDTLPLAVRSAVIDNVEVGATTLTSGVPSGAGAHLTMASLGPTIDGARKARSAGTTTVSLRSPGATATVSAAATTAAAHGAGGPLDPALSRYCRPSFVQHTASEQRLLPGTAADYRPLTSWELLVLGRLAPIEPYLVEAATSYDVPAGLLLQVLVNESSLDPLAIGKTGDKGLSQMTTDALTLLRGVSGDSTSRLYNPHLLEGSFNVFDPDFSICAGAAKLRWAMSMPGADTNAKAYALYINPVHGLTRRGSVEPALTPAVDAMEHLATLVRTLGTAYAAYRKDPTSVALPERQLMQVSADVGAGRVDLADGYRHSRDLIEADGIQDASVYSSVLTRLYPRRTALVPVDARTDASTR